MAFNALDLVISKFDSIISDTKEFLNESSQKKENVKEIELRVLEYLPVLQKKIEELKNLLYKIPMELSDQDVAKQLQKSLQQADWMLDNIKLVAEGDWAKEQLAKMATSGPKSSLQADKNLARLKYTQALVVQITDGIENTHNFFDLADYANQIAADADLLQEGGRLKEVMQLMVRKMNETNLKKSFVQLDFANVMATLEHICEVIFAKSKWSDQEIKNYRLDRQKEIAGKDLIGPPTTEDYKVLALGMCPELIDKVKAEFYLADNLKLEWIDLANLDEKKLEQLLNGVELVLAVTNFFDHTFFQRLKDLLDQRKIPLIYETSLNPARIVRSLQNAWQT